MERKIVSKMRLKIGSEKKQNNICLFLLRREMKNRGKIKRKKARKKWENYFAKISETDSVLLCFEAKRKK
jgi:hypothetical protein